MKKLEHSMTLVATKAFKDWPDGQTSDYSMPAPDPCYVYDEDEENYYGRWVFGICMFGIRFPKATTRKANEEERKKWDKKDVFISEQPWPAERINFTV